MKRYSVIWSDTAERDLFGVIEYIAEDSPSQALEVFREVKRVAASLHTFPERGRIVPELYEFGIIQYHELVVRPWRIIYRVSDGHVYVLAVLDSRRNVEDILLQRLTGQRL
jgi:toxin ParE1/3/4